MKQAAVKLKHSNQVAVRTAAGLTIAILTLMLTFGCAYMQTPDESESGAAQKMTEEIVIEDRPDPFVSADAAASADVAPAPPEVSSADMDKQAPAGVPAAGRQRPEETVPPVPTGSRGPSALEVALSGDTITSLDFQNERLSNVLKVVSNVMGVNVIAHKNIQDEKITIYLKNVTPLGALEAICNQYGFSYEEGEGHYRLVPVKDFGQVLVGPDGVIDTLMFKGMELAKALVVISERTGTNVVCKKNVGKLPLFLRLSNVRVQTAVEIICKELGLWYRKDQPNDYYVLMNVDDFGKSLAIDHRPQTRVFELKYVSAPQLAEVIALALGQRVDYTPPNMVRSYEHLKTPDFEDNEATIEAATTDKDLSHDLPASDIEADYLTSEKLQRLIGSRLEMMLTAEDLRRINQKIGFALMSIFMRNNAIIASSTDGTLLDEIGELIARLDTATPQVLIETKILRVNLTDDFTSFFDLNIGHPSYEYDPDTGTNTGNLDNGGGAGVFKWASTLPQAAGYGTAFYRFIDPDGQWSLDAAINLLKDDGLLNSISSPMIVAAQNSEAKVFVGTVDYPLVTGIDAETLTDDSGVVTSIILNPVTEKHDVGVTLRMTPQINADRSVTLRLYIEESSIAADQAQIPYYDGLAKKLMSYNVDVVDQETVNTTVNVPAGHVLALGGLVDEQDYDMENKVPVLGDLPLVGFFFKKVETRKRRSERVFLLKPHIMMSAAESGPVSREALKDSAHPFVRERRPTLLDIDAGSPSSIENKE
ncbi:MAG: hypothetical protein CR984_03480 [Proteobacteria bacterium]|nr:MAG: hypothetical protein CR984_03480 [Pseudomonadota bacterium]